MFAGWRELATHFKVDPSIMDSLEPPRDMEVHSPTTKVIDWLTAARPDTTVNDVAKALKKIKRFDALKILRSYFDFGEFVPSRIHQINSLNTLFCGLTQIDAAAFKFLQVFIMHKK